jgi:hypothetical protein
MAELAYVKRPVNAQDTARLLRDIRTYEPVKFHRVGVVERSRVLHDLDMSAEELAAVLSAGGPKVTAKDVTRWTTDEHPENDEKSKVFRKLLTGFVLVGDIRSINRMVPVGRVHAAVGSEDGRKAPVTKPKGAGNLSEQIAVAEREGDV